MKKVLALLAAFALASYTYVTQSPPTPAADPPPTASAPTPPASPAWSPRPNHMYEFDASNSVVADYDAATWGGTYDALHRAVGLDVDLNNLQHPADLWQVMGGAAS